MEKVPVVYILGRGHSGSTLLDLCLGGLAEVESVGEIATLAGAFRRDDACTCGERLSRCPYWREVLTQAGRAIGEPLENLADIHPVKSGRSPLRRALDTPLQKGDSDKVAAMGARNRAILEAVLRHGNAKVVLDSSKNWHRLSLSWSARDCSTSG